MRASWHTPRQTRHTFRGIVADMSASAAHLEAEARLRDLLEEADLPLFDRVSYEPGEIVCFWEEQKLAVIVELSDEPR